MRYCSRRPLMHHQRTTVSLLLLAASLAAQQRDDERKAKPDPLRAAWDLAQERAWRQHAPILAFVLPPADAKAPAERIAATRQREREVDVGEEPWEPEPRTMTARDLLLRQIQLLRAPDVQRGRRGATMVTATHSQAVLALSIPVVVAADRCGAKEHETVVLLGPDGRRLQGFTIDLLDAAAFCKQVGSIVLDPNTLAARRANLPAAVARDIEALPPKRAFELGRLEDRALSNRLAAQLAVAAPALIRVADGNLDIHHAIVALENDRPPLGTEAHLDFDRSCLVSCGMVYSPPALNNVLKLIGP